MKKTKYGIVFFALFMLMILSFITYAKPIVDFNIEKAEKSTFTDLVDLAEETSELMAITVFSGGSGTEDDPYLLSTPNDLKKLSGYVMLGEKKYVTAHYKLLNNIDLNGEEWTPIGNYLSDNTGYSTCFQGVFDGNDNSISNFTIFEENYYTGFFGYIYNGSVKNLTISDFKIELNSDTYIYTGALVGRFLAVGTSTQSHITNCHAINGSINAKSSTRVYGGGLIGYLHASESSELIVENSFADINCKFTVDNNNYGTSVRHTLSAGGFVGYSAAIDGASLNINRSFSTSTVSVQILDVNKHFNNSTHIGGFIGDVGAQNTGTLDLKECYSTSGVFAKSDGETYASSLLGYTIANNAEINILNCHTNSNVYACSTANNTYISGFSSILATQGSSSINIENCYTISNVIYTGTGYSDGGNITAYYTANVNVSNCYYHDNSVLYITNEEIILGTSLNEPDISFLSSYQGFTADIWEIDNSYFYPYPVLKDNKIVNDNYTMYFSDTENEYFDKTLTDYFGKIVEFPEETPENNAYKFSYWSVYPNGSDATGYKITSDTLLFPNFSDIRSYTISFYANGIVFDSAFLEYGSTVNFPEAPSKPSDPVFGYKFDYWSNSKNGSPINIDNETVTGETTYYAIYKIIPPHVWDGVSSKPFRGSGTSTDPYIIKNSYQLHRLSNLVNSGVAEYADAYYLLYSDIDLGGFEWTPIGTKYNPFTGTFNADGYSIHSFKITNTESECAGVFGYVKNAQITKLNVYDYEINIIDIQPEKTMYIGTVAGCVEADENTFISECMTDGKINISSNNVYVGGIIGYAKATQNSTLLIKNCFSSSTVETIANDSSYTGGICGELNSNTNGVSNIDSCAFSGNIKSNAENASFSGGISAFILSSTSENNTIIKNCFVTSEKIIADSHNTSHAGYIFASKNEYAEITNCYVSNKTKLSASQYSNNTNITSTTLSKLYNEKYLKSNVGLDVNNTWKCSGSSLPVLITFDQDKNVFEIKSFSYENEGKDFNVSINIKYRTHGAYTVLTAAYDGRGKMISFIAKTVYNPQELQTVNLSLSGIENASNCTVSVINPSNLQFLEDTMKIFK